MNQMTTQASGNPLVLSSRVINAPVFNRAGDRVGHVDDLSIEKGSGRVIHAIMSFGGFLRIGAKFHPVPWALLDYDVARGGFVVPLDEAALRDAPAYTAEELRELGGPDRTRDDMIDAYYGRHGETPFL